LRQLAAKRDIALLAAPLLMFSRNVHLCFPYINDDAFISFRYAKNFVAGHGLVFNLGEYVEGYTNFLWVMLSAALIRLAGETHILLAAKCLGIALSMGTIVIVFAAGRSLYASRVSVLVSSLLLASSMGLAANSVSGLETGLFTFLIALALHTRIVDETRGDGLFTVCMALAALTRPEGFLLFALLLGFHLLRGTPLRRVFKMAAIFAAMTAPYLIWKCWYYGSLLPNTYYAKPGTLRDGVGYLNRFFTQDGYLRYGGLPVALIVAGLLGRRPRHLWFVAFLSSLVAIVGLAGGDWMLGWRFMAPAMPVICMAMGQVCDHVLTWRRLPTWMSVLFVVVASCTAWNALRQSDRDIVERCHARGKGQTEAHLAIAETLRDTGSDADTVAVMDIGMIGYFSGLRVLDITGLTDAHIGRSPGTMLRKEYDSNYVLDKEPKFIVLVCHRLRLKGKGSVILDPDDLWFQGRRIYDNPKFLRHYGVMMIKWTKAEDYLIVFQRRGPTHGDDPR